MVWWNTISPNKTHADYSILHPIHSCRSLWSSVAWSKTKESYESAVSWRYPDRFFENTSFHSSTFSLSATELIWAFLTISNIIQFWIFKGQLFFFLHIINDKKTHQKSKTLLRTFNFELFPWICHEEKLTVRAYLCSSVVNTNADNSFNISAMAASCWRNSFSLFILFIKPWNGMLPDFDMFKEVLFVVFIPHAIIYKVILGQSYCRLRRVYA